MVFSFIIGLFFGSLLNFFLNIISTKINNEVLTFRISTFIPFFYKDEKKSLKIQKLILELITVFITTFLFFKLGFSLKFIFSLVVFYILILLSFLDLKHKAVPDYLLLVLLVVSFFISSSDLLSAFKNAFIVAGAFVLLNFILTFYIQNIKSKILKDEALKNQEALGEGDIPVFAVLAIVLGLKSSIIAIFLSSFFAIIPALYLKYKKQDIQTPFIPFISLGFFTEYFLQISKVFN